MEIGLQAEGLPQLFESFLQNEHSYFSITRHFMPGYVEPCFQHEFFKLVANPHQK